MRRVVKKTIQNCFHLTKFKYKYEVLEAIGINLSMFLPFSTLILRMYWMEYKNKKKKKEEKEREEKSILSTTKYQEMEADEQISIGQLKIAEKILMDILKQRLTTYISSDDPLIIINKE